MNKDEKGNIPNTRYDKHRVQDKGMGRKLVWLAYKIHVE